MAVSVDTVYQRVLAIANKEQRGYITPQEFNLLANQAQLELFEQYFYDIDDIEPGRGSSTEFSDMLHILEEKIAPFRVNGSSLTAASLKFEDTFESDITDWSEMAAGNGVISHEAPSSTNSYNGGLKILQNANSDKHGAESGVNFSLTAGKRYIVNWSIVAMDEPASYYIEIQDAGTIAASSVVYEPAVGNLSFTFIADATGNHNMVIVNNDTTNGGKYITVGNISVKEIDNTTLPTNLYRLGEVFYQASGAAFPTTVAEVDSNQMTLFNLSPLARPTTSNPAYVRTGASSIKIYPTTLGSGSTVTCNYIKKPADVVWGYNVVLGNALYNSTNSTDFELHESEETTLVMKILELAGVAMNKAEITQVAMGKNMEKEQKQKA